VLAIVCVVIGGGGAVAVVAAQPSPSLSRRTPTAPAETSAPTTRPSPDPAVNQIITIENVLSHDSGKAYTKFEHAATRLSNLGRSLADAPASESLRAKVRADLSDIADGLAGISSAYHSAATRLAATKFRTTEAKAGSEVARTKLAAVSSDAFGIAAEIQQSTNAMRMTLLLAQLGTAMSTADTALGDLNHDLGLPSRLTIS